MSHQKRRALLVIGHGSHLNAQSAAPLFTHVNTIRQRQLFAEVVPAFWKEEPSLRDVIGSIDAHEIVVVPLLISEGYFTEQILPRELGLSQPTPNTVSWVEGKRVIYAAPVGTHPAMTEVLVRRARQIIGQQVVPPEESALVIAGHGTPRNAKSSQSIYTQVELLQKQGIYGEVAAIFMDEAPFINQILTICDSPNLIVVPYFISDGFHTQEDIPEALGIADQGSYRVPAILEDRRLWYAGAVGTDSAVVEVILARAEEALAAVGEAKWPLSEPLAARAYRAFADWASERPRSFGQVMIQATPTGGWMVHHIAESDKSILKRFTNPYATEQIRRHERLPASSLPASSPYRPLSTAPTLARGWLLDLEDDQALRHAMEGLYPAAVVAWYDERQGNLKPVPFFKTAARQTGIYEEVNQLTLEQARAAIGSCCNSARCLKRIGWDLSSSEPLGVERGSGEIPCREACGLLISSASMT